MKMGFLGYASLFLILGSAAGWDTNPDFSNFLCSIAIVLAILETSSHVHEEK